MKFCNNGIAKGEGEGWVIWGIEVAALQEGKKWWVNIGKKETG